MQDNTAQWGVRKLTKFQENGGIPVGFEYFSTNPNIPAGSLPLFGGEYSREVYSDLWSWVQEQAGYLIEESEWQEKSAANDGNVPFYSKGNGTTTFRVPSLKCWVKGANGIEEVGSYLSAGLPNITGTFVARETIESQENVWVSNNGVFSHVKSNGQSANGWLSKHDSGVAHPSTTITFNASKGNSIFGNSDTVQPKSIVGMWLVKAYGTVTNVGSTDVANIAQGLTEAETRITTVEGIRGSGAGYHNSIYRGKYLGSSVTGTQWAAIKAGTFEDMYLGDYWTIGGVDWVIMAFNYYINCGDSNTTANHIVIVPRGVLYNAQMNTSNVTDGGYVGSAMYTTNLNTAKTTIANAFGSGHILTIRQLFVNTVANGYSSNGTWADATVWLMNEINVYGGKIFGDCIQGTNWAYLYTIDNSQYPAFTFNPSLIKTRQTYWLRDVAYSTSFAVVYDRGDCTNGGASNAFGVRPAFCIYQS